MLEKTKSQEKKVKELIVPDSKKNVQKSNSVEIPVVKNEELVNIEYDSTIMSSAESAVKSINEEPKKNIISLNAE